MKIRCNNCGKEIEDPRLGIANIMLATNCTVEEIVSSISSVPYCDECSKEWNRLNKLAHEISVIASTKAYREFQIFGHKKRRE